MISRYNPALALFSKLLVCAVLGLIFAGALVTSNDAGLSVPDWPTSYGHNMFLFPIDLWRGGIFYEHVHRLIASGIGCLMLILAVWIWFADSRRWVKILALIGLVAVIVQGILGGLTVIYQLPALVSTAHGMLAQTFFCLTIILAFVQSKAFFASSGNMQLTREAKWGLAIIAALYLQLFIGALMRHTESGLAVPDFPTMGGSFIPWISDQMLTTVNNARALLHKDPVTSGQVLIHLLHRAGAVLVTVVTFVALWKIIPAGPVLRKPALTLLALLFCQVSLGILTVLSHRAPDLTSLHVMVGAAMLGTAVYLCLKSLVLLNKNQP